MTRCTTCNGAGRLYHDNGPSNATSECMDCGGEGSWEEQPSCDFCDGPVISGWCASCDDWSRFAPTLSLSSEKEAA